MHSGPRLLRRLLGALALVALSGLATAAAPPAADPSQFQYDALPADGAVDLRLDASSPVFEFQSGRSAFRAFRLPATDRPYLIDVRSYLEDADGRDGGHVFYPIATLLTEDYLITRSTDLDALRFDSPLYESSTAPAYHLTLGVDPKRGRERYLVVFTPALLVAPRRLPPVTTPAAAAELAPAAFLGAAAHGRLRISVRPAAADELATQGTTNPQAR
jgi:hypothetical protein